MRIYSTFFFILSSALLYGCGSDEAGAGGNSGTGGPYANVISAKHFVLSFSDLNPQVVGTGIIYTGVTVIVTVVAGNRFQHARALRRTSSRALVRATTGTIRDRTRASGASDPRYLSMPRVVYHSSVALHEKHPRPSRSRATRCGQDDGRSRRAVEKTRVV